MMYRQAEKQTDLLLMELKLTRLYPKFIGHFIGLEEGFSDDAS